VSQKRQIKRGGRAARWPGKEHHQSSGTTSMAHGRGWMQHRQPASVNVDQQARITTHCSSKQPATSPNASSSGTPTTTICWPGWKNVAINRHQHGPAVTCESGARESILHCSGKRSATRPHRETTRVVAREAKAHTTLLESGADTIDISDNHDSKLNIFWCITLLCWNTSRGNNNNNNNNIRLLKIDKPQLNTEMLKVKVIHRPT